ncbi:MAG: glycine oxidase ThiO [Vicinamibacterales bacterium]
MSARQSVAVVGGGVIGCAVAFELARRGVDVSVWDCRAVGAGATQASAGILAPYIEGHEGGALLDLTVRGLSVYEGFVESVRSASTTQFEFRRNGTIEIADDQDRARELKARGSLLANAQWLDAEALQESEPSVSANAIGGLLCPEHGYVAVSDFVRALKEAAEVNGCVFHENIPVSAVRLEGSKCVLEVGAESNSVNVDRVVLSVGSWARALDPLGELCERVRPVRGQLLHVHSRSARAEHVLWGPSCYIVPWTDRTLLLGATSEDVGFDERSTLAGVSSLIAAATGLLPGLDDASLLGVRVGLRPATADGLPIIGPSPANDLVIYATGHFRNGVLLAPLTAQLIGDLIVGGTADPMLALTSVSRYKIEA